MPTKIERAISPDVSKTAWLRLKRLGSPTLCARILADTNLNLDSQALARKAEEVASATRCAIDFWNQDTSALNSRILSRYYAFVQMAIAEQVASSADASLASVEQHSKQGHGLFLLIDDSVAAFPFNAHVGCLSNGFYWAYGNARKMNFSNIAFQKKPRNVEAVSIAERHKLLSLAELFLRVPELASSAEECLQVSAMSFRVGAALRNEEEARSFFDASSFNANESGSKIQRMELYFDKYRDPKTLESLGLPFYGFHDVCREDYDDFAVGCLLEHESKFWWESVDVHKSPYCGSRVIAPFWGTTDVFCLHFATLYSLSILVRYLPSLWHRVETGDLDHIRSLIEEYLSFVDAIGPLIALERIAGIRLLISMPGALSSAT